MEGSSYHAKRMVALFDPTLKRVLPEPGKSRKASNEEARHRLGLTAGPEGSRSGDGPEGMCSEGVRAWVAEAASLIHSGDAVGSKCLPIAGTPRAAARKFTLLSNSWS